MTFTLSTLPKDMTVALTTLLKVMTFRIASQLDFRLCCGNTDKTSFKIPRARRLPLASPVPKTIQHHFVFDLYNLSILNTSYIFSKRYISKSIHFTVNEYF